MEKYAVELDTNTKEKVATEKKVPTCPDCFEELVENSQLLMWCKNCGTKPFEKRNK